MLKRKKYKVSLGAYAEEKDIIIEGVDMRVDGGMLLILDDADHTKEAVYISHHTKWWARLPLIRNTHLGVASAAIIKAWSPPRWHSVELVDDD